MFPTLSKATIMPGSEARAGSRSLPSLRAPGLASLPRRSGGLLCRCATHMVMSPFEGSMSGACFRVLNKKPWRQESTDNQ